MLSPRFRHSNRFNENLSEILDVAYSILAFIGVLRTGFFVTRIISIYVSEVLRAIILVGETLLLGATTRGYDKTGSRLLLHLAVRIRMLIRLMSPAKLTLNTPKSVRVTGWIFTLLIKNPLTLKTAVLAFPVGVMTKRGTMVLDPLVAAMEKWAKVQSG
jgi:hypothetical protein